MTSVEVRAEIVACVLSVGVAPGCRVARGDTLAVLESMKMEIPVIADVSGTLALLLVDVGQIVRSDELMMVVAPFGDDGAGSDSAASAADTSART